MRGLRSTIALVVVLAASARTSTSSPGRSRQRRRPPKQEKVFAASAGRQDRRAEDHVRRTATSTTLKKDGRHVADDRAGRRPRPTKLKCRGITTSLGTVDITRVIDENPANLKDYGLDEAARSRSTSRRAGDKDYREAAHRREVADRREPLREAQRRQEGLPDPGVPGNDVQPVDVRPARQDAAEVRSRQGRRHRDQRGRQDAGDREGRRRLEADQAAPDARPTSARSKGWSAACRRRR